MGSAKKTHVDTSQSGNLSGLSSIAQNAESGISLCAVEENNEMYPTAQIIVSQRTYFLDTQDNVFL